VNDHPVVRQGLIGMLEAQISSLWVRGNGQKAITVFNTSSLM